MFLDCPWFALWPWRSHYCHVEIALIQNKVRIHESKLRSEGLQLCQDQSGDQMDILNLTNAWFKDVQSQADFYQSSSTTGTTNMILFVARNGKASPALNTIIMSVRGGPTIFMI